MNRSTVLIVSGTLLLGGMLAFAPAPVTLAAATVANTAADPVNKVCPVMGGDVDKDSPTRQFKGQTVGFCCANCEGKWDKKTDDEKMALLAKNAPEVIAAINATEKPAAKPERADAQPEAAALAANPAVKVARAYMAACAKADAEALNALFLDKGRATISENAGDEGSWETYRDHHLMPELKEMPGFIMSITKEDVRTFGATSIVRQIGSFTVADPNHAELTKKYLAAVTYIVVDDGGTPKIAHLHWSSRAEKKPDAAAPAKSPDAGHGAAVPGASHDHK